MKRSRWSYALVAALVLLSTTIGARRGTMVYAFSTSQEYAVVQDVIGTGIAAQTLLSPAMNATGSAALEDAAALSFSDSVFADAQNHPASMMDAIQRYYVHSFGRGGGTTTVLEIETVNDRIHLLDLFGLSPQAQARIITHILTRPLASSYLKTVGSATIKDDAVLFTSVGKDRITQAAIQEGINLLLITNSQQFSSNDAWHSWLNAHTGNPRQITIGLHVNPKNPKNIYVIPGSSTHISQAQANQGINDAIPTFNHGDSSATSNGVIKLIDIYHGMMVHG